MLGPITGDAEGRCGGFAAWQCLIVLPTIMKIRHLKIPAIGLGLLAVLGSANHAAAQATTTTSEHPMEQQQAEYEKRMAEFERDATNNAAQYQQMMDAQADRGKHAEPLLHEEEEMHQRLVVLLGEQEQLVKRRQTDTDRYEKILDTWEKQQQQYQKSL